MNSNDNLSSVSNAIPESPESDSSAKIVAKHSPQKMEVMSKQVMYLIYYERKPTVRQPIGVLIGSNWCQTRVKLKDKEKYVTNDGIISIELFNQTNLQLIEDFDQVISSSNLVSIAADIKTDTSSDFCLWIYGERGEGIRVSYPAFLKIAANLVIYERGVIDRKCGQRHTIESISGNLLIIICDNNEVLLIGENKNYKIIDRLYEKRKTEEPINQLLESYSSARSETKSGHELVSQSNQCSDLLQSQSVLQSSKLSQKLCKILIYYYQINGKCDPIGAIVGNIFAQTLCTEILELIPKQNRSTIRVESYDKVDPIMRRDWRQVRDGEVIILRPRNVTKLYIYGEQCNGIVVTNGSTVKISAKPFKLSSDGIRQIDDKSLESEVNSELTDDKSFHFVISDRKLISFQPNC